MELFRVVVVGSVRFGTSGRQHDNSQQSHDCEIIMRKIYGLGNIQTNVKTTTVKVCVVAGML